MPEIWAEFHPAGATLADDPHQGDYFDLILFAGGAWTEVCDDHGIACIEDMIGTSREEHDHISGTRPPEARTSWSDEMENWQDPSDGIAWVQSLRAAWEDWPGTPDDQTYASEQLDTFAQVLTRAKAKDVRFRLFMDG